MVNSGGYMAKKTSDQITEAFLGYKRALAKMLARFVQPSDVEDIIQDTWVRVAQAELKQEIDHPKSFMYRTAKHLAIDHLKRADNRLTSSLEEHDFDAMAESSFDSTFLDVEASKKFEHFCNALRTLPQNCRRAFILKKVYGFSQREIAAYMNVTESAVEKHIAKGLLRCSDHMRKKGVLPDTFAKPKSRRANQSLGGSLKS